MTVSEEQAAAAEGQPPRVPPGSGSLAAGVLALPPLALVVVGLGLAFTGGGVAATQWEPVAVGMALCLAALAAVGILPAPPRASWPPLLALGGYVAWSALSLLWTQAPDATVDSVARSALLAGAAVVGASFCARPRVALALAGALGAGRRRSWRPRRRSSCCSATSGSTTRAGWPGRSTTPTRRRWPCGWPFPS